MLRGTYLEYDAYWRPDNSLDLPKLTRFIGKYEGPYVTGLFEQTNHTDLSLELGSYIMPVAIKLTSEMLQTEDVQKCVPMKVHGGISCFRTYSIRTI